MKEFTCGTCKVLFSPVKAWGSRIPKYCCMKCYQIREKPAETIKKMSDAKKGRIPWNKGVEMWKDKPHPRGTLGKPSKLKGVKLSEEQKKNFLGRNTRLILREIKFSCAQCEKEFVSKSSFKGYKPKYCSRDCFGKSIRNKKSCIVCKKHVPWMNSKYCSRFCSSKNRVGSKMSEESKKKMSDKKIGKPHFHSIETLEKIRKALTGKPNFNMRGSNHPNYTDGGKATSERAKEMQRVEYKNWRRFIFERDQFTCVLCLKHGNKLNADHILPWASFPKHRYDTSNGRTLCVECHRKTDTFGRRKTQKREEQ